MGRSYFEEDFLIDKNYICINEFKGCKLFVGKGKYVIQLSDKLKKYFEEFLYYRFLYTSNNNNCLYLIWDDTCGDGFVSKDIEKGSYRLFNILRNIWEKNNGS